MHKPTKEASITTHLLEHKLRDSYRQSNLQRSHVKTKSSKNANKA